MAKSVKNKIKNYKIGMSTTIKDKLKKIITETVFDINAVVFYSTLGIAILMTIISLQQRYTKLLLLLLLEY